MGAAASRSAGAAAPARDPAAPPAERTFGLENYGNTCYANSVLQVRTG